MAFFTRDVKVKARVGMKDVVLFIVQHNHPIILFVVTVIHSISTPNSNAKRSSV